MLQVLNAFKTIYKYKYTICHIIWHILLTSYKVQYVIKVKQKVKHFYFITVTTAKLRAYMLAVEFSELLPPPLSWYLLKRVGEPEHVDFKEN